MLFITKAYFIVINLCAWKGGNFLSLFKGHIVIHKHTVKENGFVIFNLKYSSLESLLAHNLPQWWDFEYFKDVKASIYFYLLAFITISTTILEHCDQKKPRDVVACTLIPDQHIYNLTPAWNDSRNWWNWEVQNMITVTDYAFTIISLLWNALAPL